MDIHAGSENVVSIGILDLFDAGYVRLAFQNPTLLLNSPILVDSVCSQLQD